MICHIYAVPRTFHAVFLEDLPDDLRAKRVLKRLHRQLTEDAGITNKMKEIIAQRVAFMTIQLETMECIAIKTGQFDPGVFTQMTNCLLGMLKSLGLETKVQKAGGLTEYMKIKKAG